jgi:hypothetical protein
MGVFEFLRKYISTQRMIDEKHSTEHGRWGLEGGREGGREGLFSFLFSFPNFLCTHTHSHSHTSVCT